MTALRVIRIPMKLPSLANARMHWATKAREVSGQRQIVRAYMAANERPALPAVITLTRFGRRNLDSDNLASAFKAVRDQIAEEYGVDDGSDQYEWVYRQEKCKQYAIEIRIETRQYVPFVMMEI